MNRRDEADFVAFVNGNSPTLLRTAYLLCGDSSMAEDLVQETLERVYVKWGRVRRTDQPLAYTRRMLVNLNTVRWRRSHREHLTSSGALPDGRIDAAERSVSERDELVRLLQTLPERERQVIVLRHYADLSEKAVAETLGVSLGTVKSSASRGLATLRSAFAAQEATS